MIVCIFYHKNKLNLSLIFFSGNPGGRGGLLFWKSREGGGGGLVLQEIQVRGGVKKLPHPSGGVDFFWNNPITAYEHDLLTLPS